MSKYPQQQKQQKQKQKQHQERPITIDLIRKRSEHNSNLISDLEEIALHQEELTSIGTTIGKVCGKTLRILLLQNNVISELSKSEMKYFKVLEYLNLALNNLTVVQGFNSNSGGSGNSGGNGDDNGNGSNYSSNEHLNKIDLTLNFIDFDKLEESMDCLATLRNLKELFMIGNPCCLRLSHSSDVTSDGNSNHNTNITNTTHTKMNNGEWEHFRLYVISKLDTLQILDGTPILRSERIQATQMKSKLKQELDVLAKKCVIQKAERQRQRTLKQQQKQQKRQHQQQHQQQEKEDEDKTEHCPEDRIQMSNEMAMQKAEKEKNEKANQPKLKSEKEYEYDQSLAIEKAREREEKGDIKQCNEGKWEFTYDEENIPGHITLDISIQKHLSSSLIDVDIHPTYVSIVIKSKVLRLVLPMEVKAEQSTAKRSLTTGHLLLTMPKFTLDSAGTKKDVNMCNVLPKLHNQIMEKTDLNMKRIDDDIHRINKEDQKALKTHEQQKQSYHCRNNKGLQHELIQDAQNNHNNKNLVGPVQFRNIVSERHGGIRINEDTKEGFSLDLVEASTRTLSIKKNHDIDDNDDDPPPMF